MACNTQTQEQSGLANLFKHLPIVGSILERLPLIGQLFGGSQENQQNIEYEINSAVEAGQQVFQPIVCK